MKHFIIDCETENQDNIVNAIVVAQLCGVKITRVSTVDHFEIEEQVQLAMQSPEVRENAEKVARLAALRVITQHDIWPIKDCVAPKFENKASAITYIGFLCGKTFSKMSEIAAPDLTVAYDELCAIDSAWKDFVAQVEPEDPFLDELLNQVMDRVVRWAYDRPLLSGNDIRRAAREVVRIRSNGSWPEAAARPANRPSQPPIVKRSGPPPIDAEPSPASAIQAIIDEGKAQARGEAPARPQQPSAQEETPTRRAAPLMDKPPIENDAEMDFDFDDAYEKSPDPLGSFKS